MGGSEMLEIVYAELKQYNRCNKSRVGDRSDNANICVRLPNHEEDKCAFIDFGGDLIIDWCDDKRPTKRPPKPSLTFDRLHVVIS